MIKTFSRDAKCNNFLIIFYQGYLEVRLTLSWIYIARNLICRFLKYVVYSAADMRSFSIHYLFYGNSDKIDIHCYAKR